MVVYRDGHQVTICDRCYEVIDPGTAFVRVHVGDMLTPAHFHRGCTPAEHELGLASQREQ